MKAKISRMTTSSQILSNHMMSTSKFPKINKTFKICLIAPPLNQVSKSISVTKRQNYFGRRPCKKMIWKMTSILGKLKFKANP